VVTSAAGTKIENTVIGDLRIGIPERKIWNQLEESDTKIVRATDPLYNVGAALEHKGVLTLATMIRFCLGMISSGTAVCVTAALMATDNGVLSEGRGRNCSCCRIMDWTGYGSCYAGCKFSESL